MSNAELSCAEVLEASVEFALGILPPPAEDEIAAHLIVCEACQGEVDALRQLARLVLDLIPDTEPPLRFDHRVLAAATHPRRQVRTALIALAAFAAFLMATATGLGLTLGLGGAGGAGGARGAHTLPPPAHLVSVLRDGPSIVGWVTVAGQPPWFSVTLKALPVSGPVTCDLVGSDGASSALGTFDLVRGSGSWAAPAPGGVRRDLGVRVVDRAGQVVAAATF
jgi:hypothetical protein